MGSSGWEYVGVADLIDQGVLEINDGYRVRNSELGPEGIPFVRGGDIGDGTISTSVKDHILPELADRVTSKLTQPYDVAFISKGTIGRVGILRADQPRSVFSPQVCYWRAIDTNRLSPWFVFYFLRSPEFQANLDAVKTEGAMVADYVSMSDQKRFQLPIPPIQEQQSIAAILRSLDDKIELNRRMNATLEGMAQALFKSWFVDFDPVIDNALAAGNPIPDELRLGARSSSSVSHPSKGKAGASPLPDPRFPAAFQFTEELGWIPEGWTTEPLGNHLDVLETGRRPKGGVSKYTSGVPSVGAESIFGIGQFNYGKLKFVPEEFFEKMKSGKVESYDVLLYKDGGKPGVFKPRSGMFGEGFPFETFGINEHVFRMRSSSLGQAFLYYQVSSERVFHHLAVRGGKAAIPGINQKEVNSVDFLIPSDEVRKTFNDFSQPIFEKILKSANQSRMLERLRDTLLPKLISGELRISNPQRSTKEVLT